MALNAKRTHAIETVDWAKHEAKLREMWEEGHSGSVIGRALGCSKSAVVGKAHRLGLTPRPSPIPPPGTPKKIAVQRVPKGSATLPQVASYAAPRRATRPVIQAPPEPPPPPPVVFQSVKPQPCCFPLGDPGTPAFRFCEAAGVPGRPYCPDHMRVAYVPVRDMRDNQSKGDLA